MTTAQTKTQKNKPLRIGLVIPHIFMQREILPQVIFSPGYLGLALADTLHLEGAAVTLFTPGAVDTGTNNITADLSYFEQELKGRGDTYLDLLKKHPLTFISLSRQVQSELIAKAFQMANSGQLDIVHIYTNEEDLALPFSALCEKPVVFTHHDPFNFIVKYKNLFPKYARLNWLSMSYAQRATMPNGTNWVGNIYHGLDPSVLKPTKNPSGEYVAFIGRIIEPKGVHLAIAAVKKYNRQHGTALKLKIAGKHYAGTLKDMYWREVIEPQLGGDIEYVGYIKEQGAKQAFLANARALIIPSVFDEPFGMVMIEALACETPLIGLASGAIPEIIQDGKNGLLVQKSNEHQAVEGFVAALEKVSSIDRAYCRQDFEARFTLERMAKEHMAVYRKLATK